MWGLCLFMAHFITPVSPAFAQAQAAPGDWFANAPQRGAGIMPLLVVGSEQDYPPFATGMSDATAGGFTVELWKSVAAEVGLAYTVRVRPFHQLLEEFKAGKIDVLLNLAQSDARLGFSNFSVTHAAVHGAIFVRKKRQGLESEADLAGKSIIVLNADLAHDYAVTRGWDKQLVLVDTAARGLQLLASGQHDAMLLGRLAGVKTLQELGISNVEALRVPTGYTQKFAFATQRDNPELLASINEGLSISMANGTYKTLYDKWFGAYETGNDTLLDLVKYFMPLVVLLVGWVGYLYRRRQVERRQALQAIAESRDLLLAIIAAVPVRVFWKDRSLRYLGCNMLFARDVDVAQADALIGQSDSDLGWAARAGSHAADEQAVLETGTAKLFYDECQTIASGRTICLRNSRVALRNSLGEIIGLLGIYEDITESKAVEERLQQLSAAVEQSPATVVITDLSARIVYVNPRFTEVTGYSASEAIGQNPKILHSKLTPQSTFTHLWTALSNGQAWRGEFINQRKNGDIYWEESQIVPVKSAAGIVTHYVAVKTDISLRKQLESEREEALERLQKIAHHLPGMVYQYRLRPDGTACFPFVSEAIREIYRVSPDEVRDDASKVFVNVHPEDHAAVRRSIQMSATDLSPWRQEYRLRFGDGMERWLLGSALPQRESDGGVLWHGFITDITERKQLEVRVSQLAVMDAQAQSKVTAEKIQHLAFYDALTLLPNRRLLQERLLQALESSERGGHWGAILFVDLDDFKTVNEALGHDKGDFLLQQVAHSLPNCVRDSDMIARLGSDEFSVLLEGLSHNLQDAIAQSGRVAEKILHTLNRTYELGDCRHHSTVSIGIAMFDGTHRDSIEVPMQRAELAMYHAKASGHNSLRYFDPVMQSQVSARAALEMSLREALEKKQFELYYQPQVKGSGHITGVEALVRWNDPVRGMVSPAAFIPLAEETGLILPLGSWVLETACRQLKQWADRPEFKALTIAVNVSARQFHQKDFVEQVLMVLARTGANPQQLKIELTESLMVANVEEVIVKMNALKEHGIDFSLDDFGTGYSSLSYLKRLPLSQLKIDQGFVQDIMVNSNDAAIAKMVIALADSLSLTVVAEGVETEVQRNFLEELGCHTFQGYLFSRPLPPDAFEAYVEAAAGAAAALRSFRSNGTAEIF